MALLAPISWGELLDKITILEIKSERLISRAALANVRHELELLSGIADGAADRDQTLLALKTALKKINEELWAIEDRIREKEAMQLFDHEFIELARSVYRNNDLRGQLKREINRLLKSDLVEEKQYTQY
jgi:hypothetical protein